METEIPIAETDYDRFYGQSPDFSPELLEATLGLESRGLALRWRVSWACLFVAALFGILLLARAANAQDPGDLLPDLCDLCEDAAPFCEEEPPDEGDLLTFPLQPAAESFTSTTAEPSVDLWFPIGGGATGAPRAVTYESLEVSFIVELSPEVFEPTGPGVRLYNIDWDSIPTNPKRPWPETVAYLQLKERGGAWRLQLGRMWGVEPCGKPRVPPCGQQLKGSVAIGRDVPAGAYRVLLTIEQLRVSVLMVSPAGDEHRVTVKSPGGAPLTVPRGVFSRFGHTGNEAGDPPRETAFLPGATRLEYEVRGFPAGGISMQGVPGVASGRGSAPVAGSTPAALPPTCDPERPPECPSGHLLLWEMNRLQDGTIKHSCSYVCVENGGIP